MKISVKLTIHVIVPIIVYHVTYATESMYNKENE